MLAQTEALEHLRLATAMAGLDVEDVVLPDGEPSAREAQCV